VALPLEKFALLVLAHLLPALLHYATHGIPYVAQDSVRLGFARIQARCEPVKQAKPRLQPDRGIASSPGDRMQKADGYWLVDLQSTQEAAFTADRPEGAWGH